MTFDGREFYASLVEKAAAIDYSLASNHAFVDGNKRIGHAAMETFLVLNGKQIVASVDEQEAAVASRRGGADGPRGFHTLAFDESSGD